MVRAGSRDRPASEELCAVLMGQRLTDGAIAHQDCAWYQERKIFPFTIDLRDRQITDLRRVASRLREVFPELTIETYFARRDDKNQDRVVFEAV